MGRIFSLQERFTGELKAQPVALADSLRENILPISGILNNRVIK